MPTVIPVILSGGSGSRLWPKSRHHYPKQLHRLYGQHTMLQETMKRVEWLGQPQIVICNNDQRFMVADQVQDIGIEAEIILEPVARNTAPAIVIAALKSLEISPDAIIAVFPADHLVRDSLQFSESLRAAIDVAQQGKLVTFGVVPTRPETGYGYIKSEEEQGLLRVAAFVEKPNLEKAEEYVRSGSYYWNSGMFVFSAKSLIAQIELYQPAMLTHCRDALANGVKDLDFFRLNESDFAQCANLSIDYAVMEKTSQAYMVPLSAQWSDVGSWQALWEVGDKDANENVFFGDVIAENSQGCYVSCDGRLVALVGVKDLVVVETADSVLVAHKDSSQDVKKIVDSLKAESRSEFLSHREVHRPWGSYDLVDTGNRYQVKRITVKPGASLSLQMHHHRAEHWVVVAGTAQIQKGEQKQILTENQSAYIPLGEKHRLSNPGLVPLHLIEVASGAYLAEDDIVRYEDGYGRDCSRE
jgi:mannose-1-phosphate guanylyltransferase/mannose-6-phosphate isomerase